MKKGMGGDETTFTEAMSQTHSVFAHHIRNEGSMDALQPLRDSENLEH